MKEIRAVVYEALEPKELCCLTVNVTNCADNISFTNNCKDYEYNDAVYALNGLIVRLIIAHNINILRDEDSAITRMKAIAHLAADWGDKEIDALINLLLKIKQNNKEKRNFIPPQYFTFEGDK